ncbi:Alpha/Beta hydrolase protein [Schizophyllum commune]
MLSRILGCAILAGSAVAQLSNNTVALDYGTFTGSRNDSTGVINFRGIRYADAPVGDLRWRAPVSPPSENLGNVNATSFPAACIQARRADGDSDPSDGQDKKADEKTYSEDCLFLNVYVPVGTEVNSSLPVLLFLHGGGFQRGDPDDAPADYLFESTATPFVFVTIQYRLGAYGYLGGKALGDKGDFNVGLLDQKAAFLWVRNYIKNFGGDPSRVTIWGQSGGASALLAQNGNNEGLFVGAIADSPPISLQADCNGPYHEMVSSEISQQLRCDTADDLMDCLRSANASALTDAQAKVLSIHSDMIYVFQPCIDGLYLTSRIVPALQNNTIAHVPLLFGSNTEEGAHWSENLPAACANTTMPNATEDTVYCFTRGQYPGLTRESFDRALELYPLENYNNSVDLQGQRMLGELRFICSAVLASERVPNTYQYHYDNPDVGSEHGDELAAFFDPPDNSSFYSAMRQYWTSFATGNPPQADNATEWIDTPNTRMFLHPGNVSMVNVDSDLLERCDFWHSIHEELST